MEEMYSITAQKYIDFLVEHEFNAVRIPLSVISVLQSDHFRLDHRSCGEYGGAHYLDMLDHISQRLAQAGIFLMFDMHTLSFPEENNALWCVPENDADGCSEGTDMKAPLSQPGTDQPLLRAWQAIATRFCSHRNVFMADIFNEVGARHRCASSQHAPQACEPP